jgi:hypothetical protein
MVAIAQHTAVLVSDEYHAYPLVHDGHLTFVPGDRDRVPTRFRNDAVVSSIASPIDAVALQEALRFGDGHCCTAYVPPPVPCGRVDITAGERR